MSITWISLLDFIVLSQLHQIWMVQQVGVAECYKSRCDSGEKYRSAGYIRHVTVYQTFCCVNSKRFSLLWIVPLSLGLLQAFKVLMDGLALLFKVSIFVILLPEGTELPVFNLQPVHYSLIATGCIVPY